ncbi:MAG: UTP--glucose-1-phosphate uridylyltransferase [Candidatus Thiodiazotropha taylori]|nr:UTP--glucose-1-phosphate uridylyltransferase [Candidatus Thiodiazotropha taylori]
MDSSTWLAILGGFLINILHLVEYAKLPKEKRPDFKDILFYVPYVAWPVSGGVLAFAYQSSGIVLSPILALNVGLSAPLIVRAMAESNPIKTPSIDPGDGA